MLTHGTMEDLTLGLGHRKIALVKELPLPRKIDHSAMSIGRPAPTIDGASSAMIDLALREKELAPPPHHVHGQADSMTWMIENLL